MGLAVPAAAQQTTPHALDSVQTLPTVRVQGLPATRFATGTRRTTLDTLALRQAGAGTLADALSLRTPLYLKNYGPGQLASITLRGTSARHTAVLWQGFNINLPSLGEADFALLPVSGATQVAVQHGPAGATYGTGAIGGTVLLSSPARWGQGLQGRGQLDGGSFGLAAGLAEATFSNQKLSIRTAASYRTAQNDFPYREPVGRENGRLVYGPVQRQQNAQLRQWSIAQDATLRVGEQGELTAAVWLTDADRQIQAALGSVNRHAQERDQSRRLLAGYRHVSSRHETSVRAAWFEDIINYRDDGVRSNSRVQTSQAQVEHTFRFAPTLSLRVGTEAQHFVAHVDGYEAPTVMENRFSGFGLLRYDPLPRLQLSLNVRQAFISGRRPPLTPTAGAEWLAWQHGTQQLSVKASASRSYRAPTLNERFWYPTGKPDLRPETSLGYEAGLRHEVRPTPTLLLQTELTAFRQRVDDWVQWLPTDLGYAPNNLRQVLAQGLEASSELRWKPGCYTLAARAAYAYTSSRKVRGYALDEDPVGQQLAYVPLHTAAFSTDHSWRGWLLTSAFTFTGFRYTTASGTDFLPSYLLLNAQLGHEFRVGQARLTPLVQGFNLSNLRYQSYQSRAMPGRSWVASLRVAWR
ncbi:TonB-dependent receptor plug domain-containing protein [Hymenobacter puniceus]|uniref:TonB-dependent receptor plug domain-containing protein n=1 Tax=Hymenobacter sp. BT190 TaxID=2763505 RepID=UPI0016510F4F|nr:TonB-dependent receptor [Hymenobacter sp. BT190]MBC6697077.1 TonB-dependent receptor [Hymenobacter sp. BT190]